MKSHILPFIPIIGLTAFNGSTEIEKCLEVGM
jgi:CheY-like chemotaxis protein